MLEVTAWTTGLYLMILTYRLLVMMTALNQIHMKRSQMMMIWILDIYDIDYSLSHTRGIHTLRKFTQQGCEKMNDVLTSSYFRSSNHKGLAALRQVFLKFNRLNYLEHEIQKKIRTK
jgi:hypothetical protein